MTPLRQFATRLAETKFSDETIFMYTPIPSSTRTRRDYGVESWCALPCDYTFSTPLYFALHGAVLRFSVLYCTVLQKLDTSGTYLL